MRPSALFIASIWIDPDQIQQFEAFESRAAELMRRYGGAIERVVRLWPTAPPTAPFEIHIVSFPDTDAFERYRADADVRALAAWRERVITRTELHRCLDVPPYGRDPA